MRLAPDIEILDIQSTLANGPGITHPAILRDTKNMILIDGGLPGQFPDIQSAAAQAGIPLDELNRIIITHSDMDHIGCLASVLDHAGCKIEVIAHEDEKPFIQCEVPPIRLTQLEARLDKL